MLRQVIDTAILRSKTPRSCVECRPAFGHLAQPIFTARYSGIGHYHWPIGSRSLLKPQISNHHCVLSPEKPKIFAGSQASVSSPTWRCDEVSCIRSSKQSPNNSTFVVESSFWFGIWPKTNMTKVKDQYGQTLILPMRPDHATRFTAISCQLRSPTSDLPSPQGREKLLCGSSQKRSSSVSEIRCF